MSCIICSHFLTEQYLRDERKPLFGSSPSRNVDCINALVKFAAVCSHIMQQDVVKKHCLRLLSGKMFQKTKGNTRLQICIFKYWNKILHILSNTTKKGENNPMKNRYFVWFYKKSKPVDRHNAPLFQIITQNYTQFTNRKSTIMKVTSVIQFFMYILNCYV